MFKMNRPDLPSEKRPTWFQKIQAFLLLPQTYHRKSQNPQILKAIKASIKNENFKRLQEVIKDNPKIKLLSEFSNLESFEKILFFRFLTITQAAEFFNSLETSEQEALLVAFTDNISVKLLKALKSDEIKELIDEMPLEVMTPLLKKITNKQKRRAINALLKFDEDQIGSIMHVDVSSIQDSWDLDFALEQIKNDWKKEISLSHYYFVTNLQGSLVGAVALEDIIFSPRTQKISDILFPVQGIKTYDDLQKASYLFAEQDISVLPVVNHNNDFAGVVTAEDMIDLIQEEVTEDIYKQAGIRLDNTTSYIKTPIIKLVKSRLVWLFLLLISATLSQIAIQSLNNVAEATISIYVSTTILATLIPVLSDAAGNAGAQASSATIRAAALGEFNKGKYKKLILKEFYVGLILGSILFFVNFVRLIIYFLIEGSLFDNTQNFFLLIFTSSLALWITIILAKLLGIIVPLVAFKLRKDPAVLSASLLTTILDALSIAIFFGIAIALFFILGTPVV